jgi:MarR family transcriptional regulator, organic hydroperoxide resistance regulator
MSRAAQRRGESAPEVLKLTRRMTTLFRERLEEQLRPLGITAAQFQLLAALAKEPATSGAHISRICQVTPQTTHALLAAAEGHGWVRRTPHPENARMLLAKLTPEGQRVFTRGKTVALRLQSRMLRTFTAGQVDQLEATLSQVIENLEEI